MNLRDIIKKNKKIVIILLMLIIILLIILFVSNYYHRDNIRFRREYERLNKKEIFEGRKYPFVDIPSDNVIKYSNYEELIKIINDKDDAVVYFGNAKCLYCRTVVNVLCDVTKDKKISKIYYIDTELENINDNKKILKFLGDNFIVNEDNNKNVNIPLVLFIVDGRIVSYNKGTIVSHVDPYDKLNESQLYTLEMIYSSGIQDVIDGMQNNS